MRAFAPVVASVVVALLLLIGFLKIEAMSLGIGATEGAALALAVIASFLLTYDMLGRVKRDGDTPRAPTGGSRKISPVIDPNALFVIEAASRARSKDGHDYINGKTNRLAKDTPVAFSIVVREGADLDRDHLLEQLRTVSTNFKTYGYVHFFTLPRKHLCFAATDALIKLLEQPDPGRGFVGLVNNGRDDDLVRSYAKDGLRATSIESTLTERDGLRLLAEQKAEAAMVIYPGNQKPLGVIDWPTLALRVIQNAPRQRADRREPS